MSIESIYIKDIWSSYIINPSYKILYNFLNDPRNINSKEVAIHNKLRQERINRRYFCLARGNGKWLTTQRLMEEMLNGGCDWCKANRLYSSTKEL